MNEFYLASNRTITVEDFEVFQLQMHNFDEWIGPAQKIKESLKSKEHSDEILKELFKVHTADVMLVASKSLHKSIDELIPIVEAQGSIFLQLLEVIIRVNDAFFSEPAPKHRDDVDPRKKSSWFDVFQMLVSNGHQPESIMQMSYGSFRYYLKAANKMCKQEILNSAVAARVAQSDKKGFEAFKKEMVSN